LEIKSGSGSRLPATVRPQRCICFVHVCQFFLQSELSPPEGQPGIDRRRPKRYQSLTIIKTDEQPDADDQQYARIFNQPETPQSAPFCLIYNIVRRYPTEWNFVYKCYPEQLQSILAINRDPTTSETLPVVPRELHRGGETCVAR
jgi:hypothetical protein